MFGIFKTLFGSIFSKDLEKTIMDSKLGKLVCEYKPKDTYFSWTTDYKVKNNKGEPISIYIDGDLNGPFSEALQKTYQLVDSFTDLSYEVQKQLDIQFPDKNINLSRDYSLEDISVFINEETNGVDYDLEYFTDDAKVMISVEFIDDKIDLIEFY